MWSLPPDRWLVLYLGQFMVSSANSGSPHNLPPRTCAPGASPTQVKFMYMTPGAQGTVTFTNASAWMCLKVHVFPSGLCHWVRCRRACPTFKIALGPILFLPSREHRHFWLLPTRGADRDGGSAVTKGCLSPEACRLLSSASLPRPVGEILSGTRHIGAPLWKNG